MNQDQKFEHPLGPAAALRKLMKEAQPLEMEPPYNPKLRGPSVQLGFATDDFLYFNPSDN